MPHIFSEAELADAGRLTVDLIALLSIVYESHGEAELQRVLNIVMKPESMDPDGKIPFREKVENIMTFTRCHLLPFTVTEDDEKVTFMPDPCPSGARPIRAGHCQAPHDVGISPCKIYVYKNPADIPERFYQRDGLQKPEDLIARSR